MLLKYVFNSFISSDKQKLMSYILNVTQIRNEIQKYKKRHFVYGTLPVLCAISVKIVLLLNNYIS